MSSAAPEYGCLGEEGSGVQVCNGREQEREAEKLLEEREKMGEKRRNMGLVMVINWDPHMNSVRI
jgi:hypothetical protein